MEREHRHRERPSFFWPIALITAGIIWLLVNNGTIPLENLNLLSTYWPALLILAGISLLLGMIWWPLSGLLWLIVAGVLIWVLISPPALLPRTAGANVRTETFSEPLGDAESASIQLDLSGQPNRVYALDDATDLIEAQVTYMGEMEFRVTGGAEKSVVLDQAPFSGITGPDFLFSLNRNSRPWDIGLNGSIPLRLEIDSGSGPTTLDLQGLTIEALSVDSGSGSIDINLPAGDDEYAFTFLGGSGSADIIIPSGANMDMNLDGGSGSITIDVPDDAGIQLEVRDDGSGGLSVPRSFDKVREGDGDEGTWESDNYESADQTITIVIEDQGSGSITIR